MQTEIPEMLDIPPKLMPVLLEFNKYKIFIIEGGRGSAKTQTIGRILHFIASQNVVRVFCGREIQSTIEESVYTVFCDLIAQYHLACRVTKAIIKNLLTGSIFRFKGFREQGSINIKGIEGADIVWIDEAQSITGPTLEMIIPTLRKNNCKFIFTLNRMFRDDAVMELAAREDCLHIHINYYENQHCPETLLHEAELCRINDPRKYRNIWLGEPAAAGDEYLFDFDKLYESLEVQPYGELAYRQRVLGIDFAAQGNDSCVCSVLDRASPQHWTLTEQIKWDQPDTTQSVGKIISLIGSYKPDVVVLDVGGGGWNVYCDLTAAGHTIYPFNGASTEGIDQMALNVRADAYWILREWFGHGFLQIKPEFKETLRQLEKIKQKFRGDGRRQIESKVDMKADIGHSPDEADSLVMAVYGAVKHLGKSATSQAGNNSIKRISGSKRRR